MRNLIDDRRICSILSRIGFFTSWSGCLFWRSLLANPLAGNVEVGVGVANADSGCSLKYTPSKYFLPFTLLPKSKLSRRMDAMFSWGMPWNNNKLFTFDPLSCSTLFSSCPTASVRICSSQHPRSQWRGSCDIRRPAS